MKYKTLTKYEFAKLCYHDYSCYLDIYIKFKEVFQYKE